VLSRLSAFQLSDLLQAFRPLGRSVQDVLSGDLQADAGEGFSVLVVGTALVLAGVGLDQLRDVQSDVAEVAQSVDARRLRLIH